VAGAAVTRSLPTVAGGGAIRIGTGERASKGRNRICGDVWGSNGGVEDRNGMNGSISGVQGQTWEKKMDCPPI
jgi:hypothetical protein